MKFFKKTPFSNGEIEKEYKKSIKEVHSIDQRQCFSLVHDIKEYAEKNFSPVKGEDLLAQKSEFMRIYAFRAQQWRYYHSQKYKKGKFKTIPAWCQKWQNYEQKERLKAQKKWHEILSRSR